MRLNGFKPSPLWISATLNFNKKVGINFHGETNDMTYEEREIIMSEWRNDFHANIEELDTTPELVYNVDQTSIYYQKLPNSVYVDEVNKNYYDSVRQMKDETHITLVVGTSSSGGKLPLAIVGEMFFTSN